jgi:hypothetical protein
MLEKNGAISSNTPESDLETGCCKKASCSRKSCELPLTEEEAETVDVKSAADTVSEEACAAFQQREKK